MGMTLTKSTEGAGFYSADPESVDHEIAIMQGVQRQMILT